MSKVEEDYSDYIKFISNVSSLGSVLAGFTLTTLTLLITLLPDPSQIPVQITLFMLASLFDVYMFFAGWTSFNLVYFCRRVPRLTRKLDAFNYVGLVGFSMLGGTIVMIFFLSNLIHLALASAAIWILYIIATYALIWKPFRKFSETRAQILGKAKKKERVED